ncbi:MAG: gamma-glutamyl-gamma-aminobutyrate hydrolase family protein [Cyanophyceae cyanobacterium]
MTFVKSPLIGLTTYSQAQTGRFYVPGLYVEAVHQAGGTPLLLPPVPTDPTWLLTPLDGLVLIGGGDIDPQFYRGAFHPSVYNVDPRRDQFELELVQTALEHQIPLLGICRGLEIIVVAEGGDLIPHVPEHSTTVVHRTEASPSAQHAVEIVPSSQLAQVMGVTATTVVSIHHQATQTVPPRWRAVARAEDGIIEALEHESHPFALAVQWHPELSLDNLAHLQLFQGLVQAAQGSCPKKQAA